MTEPLRTEVLSNLLHHLRDSLRHRCVARQRAGPLQVAHPVLERDTFSGLQPPLPHGVEGLARTDVGTLCHRDGRPLVTVAEAHPDDGCGGDVHALSPTGANEESSCGFSGSGTPTAKVTPRCSRRLCSVAASMNDSHAGSSSGYFSK